MREIGSDFWGIEQSLFEQFSFPKNARFFISGRSALVHIIKDILASNSKFNVVALPSYLCHTMIQPFIELKVKCIYYDIDFKNDQFHIDFNKNSMQCDAILIMEYFGYKTAGLDEIVSWAVDNSVIVIEDTTHRFMSDEKLGVRSDYSFASLRKWTGLAAGAYASKKENFKIAMSEKMNRTYIELRNKAMCIKENYIKYTSESEKQYLNIFKEAERILDAEYIDYSLPENDQIKMRFIDREFIRNKRYQHAVYLHEELSKMKYIKTIKLEKGDVPLFVPIFVNNSFRKYLISKLIENSIYCPIHWPFSKIHRKLSIIYDEELSIVCDQRYSLEDMKKIINVIKESHAKFYEI